MTKKMTIVILLAVAGSLHAATVSLPEKYLEHPESGDFTTGAAGQAVGLWTGQPLVYPVMFNNSEVREGTISLWLRPAARYVREYDIQRFFNLGGISFTLNGQNMPWPERRLNLPGAHITIGDEATQQFNHLLYTWKNDQAEAYFNGVPMQECQEFRGKLQPPVIDGRHAELQLHAPLVIWMDEIVVLDRYTDQVEAKKLYTTPAKWTVDEHTAFYAGFDGTFTATGYIRNDGDRQGFFAHVGRMDAKFRQDDTPAIDFHIINSTPRNQTLVLQGKVRNLDRDLVLEQEHRIESGAGKVTLLQFDMSEIENNGLFWGYFTLLADGVELQSETIPFARTLMGAPEKSTPESMQTGLVVPDGFPRGYDKWCLVFNEGWHYLEPEPGRLRRFDRLDFKVNNLIRTGRRPVMVIFRPPQWFEEKYRNSATLDGYYFPDTTEMEAMELWRNFTRTLAERYKGKIYDYRVGGESYFRACPKQYGALLNMTAETLHAVDPEIRVASDMDLTKWGKTVGEITAGNADYYVFHPYRWVSGRAASLIDEIPYQNVMAYLKEIGANAEAANTEYAAYTLLRQAIDDDGYPMTAAEFEKSGRWNEWAPRLQARGRAAFVDWYTAAFRAVRGITLNRTLGCRYEMWWTAGSGSGISDLKFAPHTPTPASVAYANTAAFLDGSRFQQRIDMHAGAVIKAYLFERDGKYLMIAFSDDDVPHRVSTVYMRLPGEETRVMDMYGNPAPAENFAGIYRLDFGANQPFLISGLSGIPQPDRPVLKPHSLAADIFAGRKSTIHVTAYNPLPETISGVISLELPDDFRSVPAQPATLAPQAELNLTFDVLIPAEVQDTLMLYTRFETEHKILKTVVVPLSLPVRLSAAVTPAAPPPVIDGDLAEWGDIIKFPIVINRPEQVVKGTPYTQSFIPRIDWKGPEDLSARAAVAHDGDNLYLAVRVWDDVVFNPQTGKSENAGHYDSITVYINGRSLARQTDDTYDLDIFKLVFVPPTDIFPAPAFYQMHPNPRKLPRHYLDGMIFALQRLSDGYTLEAKFPMVNFKFSKEDLASQAVGFDLVIADRDETTEMRKELSLLRWSGSVDAETNPMLFGRLLFD